MRVNVVYASREPGRGTALLEALSASGMSVTTLQRAKEVQGILSHASCDLLIVGQKLADEDGLAFVKNLRARGPNRQLPIVALVEHAEAPAAAPAPAKAPIGRGHPALKRPLFANSAPASTSDKTSVKLAFFQAGADECLSLGWDVAECVARIKSVLRRTQDAASEELIKMGPIELNLTSYTLHVSGRRVPLTSKELDLLYVFLSSANRVLSRPYLIERVWGYNYFGSPRTVDVHVRRLREKLGAAARFITTIPCVGYKLVPPGGDSRR
ncbi:MAG: response regulator transcription factor [Elusimicrobia bacterium]|nr:response regulator transcription factor [Elusimicrobiota bacterium]MDE2314067.1 response regulator transcription factor [Elusimicrobiota bacterium]